MIIVLKFGLLFSLAAIVSAVWIIFHLKIRYCIMSGVNKVILAGFITDIPTYRSFANGTKMLTFHLVTTETHSKGKLDIEHQERHHIVVPTATEEKVKHLLDKDILVYIEGSIKTRTFIDQQGIKQHAVDIIASSIQRWDSHARR